MIAWQLRSVGALATEAPAEVKQPGVKEAPTMPGDPTGGCRCCRTARTSYDPRLQVDESKAHLPGRERPRRLRCSQCGEEAVYHSKDGRWWCEYNGPNPAPPTPRGAAPITGRSKPLRPEQENVRGNLDGALEALVWQDGERAGGTRPLALKGQLRLQDTDVERTAEADGYPNEFCKAFETKGGELFVGGGHEKIRWRTARSP